MMRMNDVISLVTIKPQVDTQIKVMQRLDTSVETDFMQKCEKRCKTKMNTTFKLSN